MDELVPTAEELKRELNSPAVRSILCAQLRNADGQLDDRRDYPVERVVAVSRVFRNAIQPEE